MKRYERYKDSGVEWLGEVPEHWEVKRLKYICNNIQTGTTPPTTKKSFFDGNINWFNPADLNTEILEVSTKKISHHAISAKEIKLFNSDSILVVGIGATTGKTSYMLNSGTFNQQITGFHSKIENNKYLFYSFKCFSSLFLKIANYTTLPILNNEFFKSFSIVLPPFQEQERILTFLDDKCGQIDRAVGQKERMIELLNERRQIIIQRAVTRGLNPDAPLKDSGIDWIGQIPSHWQVKRQKHLTSKIGSGITPSGGSTVYVDYGIPLLRSQNIHFDQIDLTDVAYITDYIDSIMSNSRVCDGDVLLNITGGSIGRCNFIKDLFGRANVNQHVCILRPTAEIKTLMLYYLMRSSLGQHQVEIEQTGGNREGLTFRALKEFRFAIPPIEEQLQITNYLDNVNKKTEKAISLKKQEIEQLKEYKQTLINSAVTGKIKIE